MSLVLRSYPCIPMGRSAAGNDATLRVQTTTRMLSSYTAWRMSTGLPVQATRFSLVAYHRSHSGWSMMWRHECLVFAMMPSVERDS